MTFEELENMGMDEFMNWKPQTDEELKLFLYCLAYKFNGPTEEEAIYNKWYDDYNKILEDEISKDNKYYILDIPSIKEYLFSPNWQLHVKELYNQARRLYYFSQKKDTIERVESVQPKY